ncbi:hypothetical protein ACFO9E_28760 [Streptomyces maoxianensis]|uniref:Uncharacterized protein n=1 Tax=Streptomyces maoxianensis TaxID=1459942 RepID=A0ABV9GF03_9ACTN
MKRKHKSTLRPPAEGPQFETVFTARRRIRASVDGWQRVQLAMRENDARIAAEHNRDSEANS